MHDSNMQSQDFPVKVSVAMAVYNAAEYMESAIRNILAQTFTDYELLLIDDGSTDRSREIAEAMAAADSRIRCIFKECNEGLAVVRNMSISEAKGEYLIMVDADDLMETDTIAKAVETADKTQADVVMWDYDVFFDKDPLPVSGPSCLSLIDTGDRKSLIYLPAFMPIRLIRTEYARERNLVFPEGLTKQDIPVHWSIMTDSRSRITLIPERLFHYRQHKNATSARKGKSLFSLAKVMDIAGDQLKADGIYQEYKECYLSKRLTLLHGMYDFIMPEYKDEALRMTRERLDDEARDFIRRNKRMLSSRTRWFYGMLQGNWIDIVRYKCLMMVRSIYRKYAR